MRFGGENVKDCQALWPAVGGVHGDQRKVSVRKRIARAGHRCDSIAAAGSMADALALPAGSAMAGHAAFKYHPNGGRRLHRISLTGEPAVCSN
jgi:hypothetical protein